MTSLFVLACIVLVVTGFCRAVRMDPETTVLPVSIVIWTLTAAALAAIGAVFAGEFEARWPDVLLVWAMAAVQVVTGALWRDGVPLPFRRQG